MAKKYNKKIQKKMNRIKRMNPKRMNPKRAGANTMGMLEKFHRLHFSKDTASRRQSDYNNAQYDPRIVQRDALLELELKDAKMREAERVSPKVFLESIADLIKLLPDKNNRRREYVEILESDKSTEQKLDLIIAHAQKISGKPAVADNTVMDIHKAIAATDITKEYSIQPISRVRTTSFLAKLNNDKEKELNQRNPKPNKNELLRMKILESAYQLIKPLLNTKDRDDFDKYLDIIDYDKSSGEKLKLIVEHAKASVANNRVRPGTINPAVEIHKAIAAIDITKPNSTNKFFEITAATEQKKTRQGKYK